MAVCQNLVPLVNIKIAGKWMFIPLKMVLIGIDPYPYNYYSSIITIITQLMWWLTIINHHIIIQKHSNKSHSSLCQMVFTMIFSLHQILDFCSTQPVVFPAAKATDAVGWSARRAAVPTPSVALGAVPIPIWPWLAAGRRGVKTHGLSKKKSEALRKTVGKPWEMRIYIRFQWDFDGIWSCWRIVQENMDNGIN